MGGHFETDWFRWDFLRPNRLGFTHVLTDRKAGRQWLVHASSARFEFVGEPLVAETWFTV